MTDKIDSMTYSHDKGKHMTYDKVTDRVNGDNVNDETLPMTDKFDSMTYIHDKDKYMTYDKAADRVNGENVNDETLSMTASLTV